MSAALAPTRPTAVEPQPTGPIFPDVLRSELTKLRTVPSTYWTLLGTVVIVIGFSAVVSTITVVGYSKLTAQARAALNPIGDSVAGLQVAVLTVAELGVLAISAEYGSGTMRSSISAVPQRFTLLAAKAALLAPITAVVGIASCFAAFFVGQAILSREGIQANIGDPGALRAVVLGGLYLGVLSLLALGAGALIRRRAGAIAVVLGLLYAPTFILSFIPGRWAKDIGNYIPSSVVPAIQGKAQQTSSWSPWVEFGVFCLWAAAALVAGAMALQRRDA